MFTFQGTYTALVTPFSKDGSTVDYDAYAKLIQTQLDAGIEGIVVLGTTGESPTISHDEFEKLIATAVEAASGNTQVIVGTGSNSTEKTIATSKEAQELGADGLLVVNPYYNKPSQAGLEAHFTAVADAVNIPIMLYNIAGRTAVNLATDGVARLANHQNIVAVKEASGNLSQMMDVIQATPADFAVLVGDDELNFSLTSLGGQGVVSVLSNLLPTKVKALTDAATAGDMKSARALHYELLPVVRGCFCETNPLPIKTALALRGDMEESFRLPLVPMQSDTRSAWEQTLKDSSAL